MQRRCEQGWALISVLWALTMLSLMAAAALDFGMTSESIERRAWERTRADSILDAGVARAILGITEPVLEKRWRVDGVPRHFSFDNQPMDISVQDERGRFDLNIVDAPVLNALLRAAGLNAVQADTLTDRILDWRSPSDLHRLHGATDADYLAAGLAYRERHAPYESVDELRLVLGMTQEVFRRIEPALTVYTHQPLIDASVAPREALLALYANDAQKVDTILAARTGHGLDGDAPGSGTSAPQIALAGRAFSITVIANVGDRTLSRYAVVELTGDDRTPYLTMAWR